MNNEKEVSKLFLCDRETQAERQDVVEDRVGIERMGKKNKKNATPSYLVGALRYTFKSRM